VIPDTHISSASNSPVRSPLSTPNRRTHPEMNTTPTTKRTTVQFETFSTYEREYYSLAKNLVFLLTERSQATGRENSKTYAAGNFNLIEYFPK